MASKSVVANNGKVIGAKTQSPTKRLQNKHDDNCVANHWGIRGGRGLVESQIKYNVR